MKYISTSKWKSAERSGDFTKASKLLLTEMNDNCARIHAPSPESEIAYDFYSRFMYINNLLSVPRSTFYEIKAAREEMKNFINML